MMLIMLLGRQGLRSHHAHGRVAFGSTCRSGEEAEPP